MPIASPAQAYWNQRLRLSSCRNRVMALVDAVGRTGDLSPFQWAQLMAFSLEFSPDIILELGRGYGNSTCAFTEAANQLKPHRCRVLSICKSENWERDIMPKVRQFVPKSWFQPLQALQADILTFDFKQALAGFRKVLVFWDAHGYEVAECVLGLILPEIANRPHIVIMHDLTDARYISESYNQYGNHGLWKGNDWDGPRIRIGHINSPVEQAVAITDFATRNKLPLHSAGHSLHTEFDNNTSRAPALREALGDQLFSLNAYWFWFSLNEIPGPYTFPVFCRERTRISLKGRLKVAIKVLLNRYPAERFLD